jgi:hypothetical protein
VIWLVDNIIDDRDVTIASSSEMIKFPLSNLYADQLSKFTRLSQGSQYIQISAASPKTIDSIALAGINFVSVVFQASNDGFITTVFSQTITISDREKVLFALWDNPITALSFRILFSGSGVKDIGKLFVGKRDMMPGMDATQELTAHFTNKVEKSLSGQVYGNLDDGYSYLTIKVQFPRYNIAYKHRIMEILSKIRNVKTIFVKVWNKGTEERMVYCRQAEDAVLIGRSGSQGRPFKNDVTFEECF